MATPITVNLSTTLVQIDTSVFANAPHIVLLSNLNSPGSLITIRDTFGAASSSNTILISTTNGVSFLDGGGALSNLYTINQPYGFLTVTPKTPNIWGVTNTFAFPDSSQVANLNAINVSSMNISSIGYIQNAIISTASISTICTNNLFINANMSVGQSTIAHAGFFVCSIRTLDDFIASSNIYAGSTISSLFGNITSTLTVPYISTTDVWINGGLQTASSISTAGPMFVGSSISTTGNLAVGASTFIQGQLTVLQAAFFGSSISTTGALNVGYEAILNSSLQVSHNAFIGGNVSTMSNMTVAGSVSVMSSLYTQWNINTNSSIFARGSFSTLQDVNIGRNLSTLGKAFIGQELYTTSSILATGSFSTLQDVNVSRNVSVLGNLYVKGTIQFDQTEVDLQDIMASSIITQYNISSMSSFIAGGGLNIRQSTFLGGTVSSMSNFNIAGLLSTASTVVVGDSLIVAKTGFFGSNISTLSSIGVGGLLRVGGGAVLQSTLSTFGQAAFFSSVQIQGSMSVMSSIAAACNVFVGHTLSTSNLILYGSTSISTLAVTNTIGFGLNISSSTLHFGLFSTSGAMNIGGRISTTNALTVGSTIDTQFLNVQRGMSVFSNAGFAQDVFARSSLLVGMSTVLNGGFYTEKSAYMADVQFTKDVVIGNDGGLQPNFGNLNNFGTTTLKGDVTVTNGTVRLANSLQIGNDYGNRNLISNDTWMSSLTASSLVVSYYQSTIGNAAFFSSVQVQGGMSVFSSMNVLWNANFSRNLAASTICTNQLTISTLNVIAPSNTSLFVSSSTLHFGLFSSFGQIFTGKEISTMSSLSAGGNLNILSNATIGRNLSTLGTAGFGTTVNILGTTTGQGTAFFNTNLVTPLINNSSLQTSSILTSTLTSVNTTASNAFAISTLIQSNLYVPFINNSSLQTSSIMTSTLSASNISASNIFTCNIAISSMMASTINVSTLSTVNLNASSIGAPLAAFSTMSVFSQAVISNVFARAIGVNCNSPQYAVDVVGIVNASQIYQNGSQYVPLISNLAFSSISTNYARIRNTIVPSYFVAVTVPLGSATAGIYTGATPGTLAAVTPTFSSGTPTSFSALYYTGSVWYLGASNATNSFLYTATTPTTWTAVTPVTGALPSRSITSIAFNGQYYLLAGADASGNVVKTTDFKAFTGATPGATRTVKTLVWNNSIWLAGGKDSSGNVGFIAYSPDGVTWTTATTTFTEVFSIVWNGTTFVAMGNDATTNLKYSSNGITWTDATAPLLSLTGNSTNSILAWSGKMFVAIQAGTLLTSAGRILYSTNGISWTAATTTPVYPTSVTWDGVRFFIICGTNGSASTSNNIFSSFDGITWTSATVSLNSIPIINFTTNTTPTLDVGNTSFYTNAQPQFQGNQSTNTVTMLSNAIVLNNLYTDNTGRVGINTNTPGFNLDVGGSINFTGTINSNGSPLNLNTAGINSAGNVGINTPATSFTLTVNGSQSNASNLYAGQIPYVVTTLAGSTQGSADGLGTSATFNSPFGICIDSTATNMYVVDRDNHRIRRIFIATGSVTTLAGSSRGSADGTGIAATFNEPTGICIDSTATNMYVADTSNHRIRRIVITTGAVTTLAGSTQGSADGTGIAATFNGPQGICIDSTGTNLYVVDRNNHRIRMIVIATGAVTTVAGSSSGSADGTGTAATFNTPQGICIDSSATTLYVTDRNNHRIRKIVIATAVVTTLAGSTQGSAVGIGTSARFNGPSGICIDSTETKLYIADNDNNRIRMIVIATAVVTTVAGSSSGSADGIGTSARFSSPTFISIDSTGTILYLTDRANHRIRKIVVSFTPPLTVGTNVGINTLTPQYALDVNGTVNATQLLVNGAPVTGSAPTTQVGFANPYFANLATVTADPSGNMYIADKTIGIIRMVTPTGFVSFLAGAGSSGIAHADGTGAAAVFNSIMKISYDAFSQSLIIADAPNIVCALKLSTGVVTTFVDSLNGVTSVCADGSGNYYISDSAYIYRVTPANLTSITAPTIIAGSTTLGYLNSFRGTSAKFRNMSGLSLNTAKTFLFIADGNEVVRRLSLTSPFAVATVAGRLPALTDSATFTNSSISGIQLWFDGRDPNADGSAIVAGAMSIWRDKSGNGRNATAANSPNIASNGEVRFAATSHFTTNYIFNTGAETGFAVALIPGTRGGNGTSAILDIGTTNVTNGRQVLIFNDGNGVNQFLVGRALTGSEGNRTLSIPEDVPVLLSYTLTSTTLCYYYNGTQIGQFTGSYPFITTGNTSIGNANVNKVPFSMFEIILYNRVLPDVQRQQVEAYLIGKWNCATPAYLPPSLAAARTRVSATSGTIALASSSISGLQLWLDGADPADGAVPAGGAVVATWSDKSGNTRNATGIGSPTFTAGGGITFNGTTQYYTTALTAVPTTETGFIVVSLNTLTAGQDLISGSATGGREFALAPNFITLQAVNDGTSALYSRILNIRSNERVILSYTTTSTRRNVFYNGLNIMTGTPATYYYGSATTVIGAYASGSQPVNGIIYEVLIFNTVLSDVNRLAIENYLNAKWSVYVPNQLKLWLDSSDPYASSKPAAPNASISRWADKSANQNHAGSLVLWLDACDVNATGIPQRSPGTVDVWRDKSGYGYDALATKTTVSSVVYPRYLVNSQNNLPVVQLQGNTGETASSYLRSSIPPGTFLNEIHIFIVYIWSNTTTAPTRPTLFSRNNSTIQTPSANPIDLVKIANTDTTSSLGIGNNNALLRTLSYNIMNTTFSMLSLQVSQTSQTITMYANGTNIPITAGTWQQSDTGDTFTIGTRANFATGFNGNFGEIMVFNTNINDNQRIYLEGYLASKWGLQASLPAGHAYSTNKNFGSPRLGPVVSTTRPNTLVVWLDGADPLGSGTAPTSGAAVPTWYDKSGYGNNGSAQAVSNVYPTYTAAGINFIKASQQFYNLPDFSIPYGNSSYTIIIVSNLATSGIYPLFGAGATRANSCISVRSQNTNIYTYWFNNDHLTTSGTVPAATNFIYTTAYTTASNGNNRNIYINGRKDGNSATASTSIRTQPPINNTIGKAIDTPPADFLTGSICEVLVFNYELPNAQRQIVEGYLARKWSIVYLGGAVPATSVPPSIVAAANLSIPGANSLQLWVDGSDPYGTGIAPPGNTNIGTLIDKSGNENHLTQAVTANQPVFNLGAVQFNTGSPTVGKMLNIPLSILNNTRAYTIFLVFKPIQATNIILGRQHDSVDSGNYLTMTQYVGSTGGYLTGTTGRVYWHPNNASTNVTSAQTYSNDTLYILSLVYDGATTTFYQNGVLDVSLASVQNIANDYAPSFFYLGSGDSTAVSTNFNLHSMMVYNTALPTPQRQTVEGYLASRYTVFLPSSHPFCYRKPSWVPTAVQASGLSFDGASQYLVSPLPSIPTSESGFFVTTAPLVGGTFMAGVGISAIPSSGTTVASPKSVYNRQLYLTNTNFWSGVENGGQTTTMNFSLSPTALNIISYTYSTATGTIIYLNGLRLASDTTIKTNLAGAGTLALGCYFGPTPLTLFNGTMYEIMMFNTDMTDTDRKAVEAYLGAKWNIQLDSTSMDDIGVTARFNTLGGIAADSFNNLYVGDSNLLRYVNMENTFVASTIPGLQIWLDGGDPLATGTAPANGTVISTWNDKSGNGRNATSVGSPAYNSSSGAIVLNGTSQGFSLTYSGIHPTETTFMVVNLTSPSAYQFFINSPVGFAREFYNYNNFLTFGQQGVGTNATNMNALIANSNIILGFSANSTNSFIFFNGMPGPTGTAFAGPPSESTLFIGYHGTSGLYVGGTISEVLIYDQVLSASQRQQVEGYLAAKWRITLPTTHPYFGATSFSASVTGVVAGNGTASNFPGVGSNSSLTSPLDVAVVNGTPFITAGTSFFSYNPSSGYLNTFLQSTGNSNQANINASSNISTQTISGVATTTIFGSGINTVNTNVRYSAVIGITCDSNNTVYVGDKFNIRAINSNGAVTTVVGQPNNTGSITDTGAFASIGGGSIYGICVDNSGNIYFTQSFPQNSLLKYTVSTGIVSNLLIGTPLENPRGMVYDGSRYIYIANYGGTNANGHGNIIRYDTIANTATVIGSNVPGFTPSGIVSIAINGAKTLVFIGDNNNSMIWVLNISVLSIAAFVTLPVRPYSLACDSVGNVFAQQAQQIYKTTIQFPPSGGVVGSAPTLFATTTATAANGMTTDTNNNIYLTDYYGNVIWRVTQNAVISVYSGNGLSGKNDSSYISSLTIIGQINAPQGFSGNTGFNCNAPQHALDVTGIIHTNRTLFSDGELIVGTSNQTAFLRTTVQGGATYIQSGTALESQSVAPLFFTGLYGGPHLMALTATGLGIGTTSPAYKLDVVGDINFTGNLRQNGVIFSGGGGSGNLAITGSVTVNNFAFNQVGAGVNASLGNVLIGSNASGFGVIQTNGSANTLLIGGITSGGTVQIWLNNLQVDKNLTVTDNVGIGTTTPLAKLDILGGHINAGTGGSNMIAFQISGGGYRHFITTRHNSAANTNDNAIDFWLNTGGTSGASSTAGTGNVRMMSVTAAGVGINCNTPAYTLDVNGTTNLNGVVYLPTNTNIRSSGDNARRLYFEPSGRTYLGSPDGTYSFQNSALDKNTFTIDNVGNVFVGANSTANLIRFHGTTGESPAGFTRTVIGEYLYGGTESSELILFKGDDNETTYGRDRVRVLATGGFQVDIPANGANWTSGSAPPAASIAAALCVAPDGNVGIGTTSPGYKLDVNGTTNLNGIIRFKGDVWHIAEDGIARFYYASSSASYFRSGDGRFIFRDTADTDKVIITNSGSVGIGTNSPGYNLDVVGRINATSDVNIGTTGAGFMRFTTQGNATYIQSSSVPQTGTGAGTGNFVPIYFTGMSGAANQMALTTTGLGIGTTTPGYKLHVNGTTYLDGEVSLPTDKEIKGSSDGKRRLLLINNGRTYFGSPIGEYSFQNDTLGINTFTILNNGDTHIRGKLTVGSWDGIIFGTANQDFRLFGEANGFMLFTNNAYITNGTWVPVNSGYGAAGDLNYSYLMTMAPAFSANGITFQSAAFVKGSTTIPSWTVLFTILPTTGNATLKGSLTQNSDIRLKENIVTIDSCLDKVKALRGVYFTKKDNPEIRQIGFIAQEVEKVLPEVVFEDLSEEKIKSIAYQNIVPVLIEAIKEQNTTITSLQAQVASQQSTINAILAKLNM